ncbi:MAG TPA: SMC-Scp complex subunit ScpB, partial [Hanamia sp.]|nr:SMC-Scp complex subunit ScpB [Hanamia sp.]
RKEDAVGKPLIYATSKSFMDYFGINSPEDLPKINEILKQEIIEATKIEKQESADASEKESLKEKIIVEEIEEVIASEESDFEETVNNSNEENNSEENNTA